MNDTDLQQRLQSLPPDLPVPADRFDRVMRRARRRRRQQVLGAGGGALAAIAAVAVAAASITAGGTGGIETITPATTSPTPTPPAASPTTTSSAGPAAADTPRFIPQSVSFVSADMGFAWGPASSPKSDTTTDGVLGVTHDGGRHWAVRGSGMPFSSPAGGVLGQVLFRDANHGYLYGDGLYVTADGGLHWSRQPISGRITDLGFVGNHLFAVVQPCPSGGGCTSQLDEGSVSGADLSPVAAVPGAPSRLTVAHNRLFLISHAGLDNEPARMWTTASGSQWSSAPVPCPPVMATASALAAWSDQGLALVCGGVPGAGQQQKTVYASTDGGLHWSAGISIPWDGYVGDLVAFDADNWVLSAGRGSLLTTHDGGHTWSPFTVPTLPSDHVVEGWGELAQLDSDHLVAVPYTLNGALLAVSDNRGDTWSTVLFSTAS